MDEIEMQRRIFEALGDAQRRFWTEHAAGEQALALLAELDDLLCAFVDDVPANRAEGELLTRLRRTSAALDRLRAILGSLPAEPAAREGGVE